MGRGVAKGALIGFRRRGSGTLGEIHVLYGEYPPRGNGYGAYVFASWRYVRYGEIGRMAVETPGASDKLNLQC